MPPMPHCPAVERLSIVRPTPPTSLRPNPGVRLGRFRGNGEGLPSLRDGYRVFSGP